MALYKAVKNGDFESVKHLLENGANPNKHRYGKTALYIATSLERLDIMECLLNFKADPHIGSTPLHYAARYTSLDSVKLLLDNEVDVNSVDRTGWTPLHCASLVFGYDDRSPIVNLLLERKAEPNALTDDGFNSLHLAVYTRDASQSLKSIDYLLKGFVDVHAQNKHGETPLDIAKQGGNADVIERLERHSLLEQSILECFNSATWINDPQLLKFLPNQFREQSCILAQLWSDKTCENLIGSLPLELFHVLLVNMWDEYWNPENSQ